MRALRLRAATLGCGTDAPGTAGDPELAAGGNGAGGRAAASERRRRRGRQA